MNKGIRFLGFCLGAYLLGTVIGMAVTGLSQAEAVGEEPQQLIREEDWGLGFGREGEKPTGNVSAETLSQYQAWYVAPGQEKVIYLTFDAGYENGNTQPIFGCLEEAWGIGYVLFGGELSGDPTGSGAAYGG